MTFKFAGMPTIKNAIETHGFHTLTSELLKQAGQPYPIDWNLKTAMLTVMLKMAENRSKEREIMQGIVSYMKVLA